jgi:small subunit ribosomal protein S9
MVVRSTPAVGKRKTSIARIFLKPGSGQITVNKLPLNEYFLRPTSRMVVRQPLVLTQLNDAVDIFVNVNGGGLSGQAGAIRHGIARALTEYQIETRFVLKPVGLLTRDSRKKERKMYGRRGARARFQYSKR